VADVRATVDADGAQAQTQALIAWSRGDEQTWDRLDELELPVLLGHGAHDVLMDRYNAYAMSTRLRDAKLVLYGDAGHAFLFQHHDDFAREVLAFLR
jgi:pimeloyl-ACP methyl ester carboxylesterase